MSSFEDCNEEQTDFGSNLNPQPNYVESINEDSNFCLTSLFPPENIQALREDFRLYASDKIRNVFHLWTTQKLRRPLTATIKIPENETPTQVTSPSLPEIKLASEGDDESEKEIPHQRKKNRLARKLRLQNFFVNGPAFANMPFNEGYCLKNKISQEPAAKDTLRHRVFRTRSKTSKNWWMIHQQVSDLAGLKDEKKLQIRLVQLFQEKIEKVVKSNSKVFNRLRRSSRERDPGRLLLLLIREECGLTIGEILTSLCQNVGNKQGESFVTYVVSRLVDDKLFKLRHGLMKKKTKWMLRASRYRRWIQELHSSSSDEQQ